MLFFYFFVCISEGEIRCVALVVRRIVRLFNRLAGCIYRYHGFMPRLVISVLNLLPSRQPLVLLRFANVVLPVAGKAEKIYKVAVFKLLIRI